MFRTVTREATVQRYIYNLAAYLLEYDCIAYQHRSKSLVHHLSVASKRIEDIKINWALGREPGSDALKKWNEQIAREACVNNVITIEIMTLSTSGMYAVHYGIWRHKEEENPILTLFCFCNQPSGQGNSSRR